MTILDDVTSVAVIEDAEPDDVCETQGCDRPWEIKFLTRPEPKLGHPACNCGTHPLWALACGPCFDRILEIINDETKRRSMMVCGHCHGGIRIVRTERRK